MRILITGSRDANEDEVRDTLDHEVCADDVLVHGGCSSGADLAAADYPNTEVWAADWDTHGKAAGPIRNQQMVDSRPDYVLAFFARGAGNGGTSDCVRRALRAGLDVVETWVNRGE